MTAVPNWDIAGPSDSDADLARACAAGDKRAFAQIYDRYAHRLHDFCAGMLGDRDAAADCVQDAFCIAATRLSQLRDPDLLRPWLYSVARNEALRRLRDRRRETPSDELPDVMSADPGPDTMAARTELADLIAEAAGGLSDRDRSALELAFRHGLGGPELAEALDVTPATANTIVKRLRDTIERSLGALLVSRRVREVGGCPELAAILQDWDGHFNVLMRKRISRHIESCAVCDDERRRLVTPTALLGAAPVFIPAPAWLRDRTLDEVQLTSASSALAGDESGPNDTAGTQTRNGNLLPAAVFIVALIAATAAVLIWFNQKTVAITPTEVGTSTPPPPPAPALPPPPTSTPPPSVKITTTAPPPPPPQPTRTRLATPPPPTSVVPPPPEPSPPVEQPPTPPPPPPPPQWPEWLPPLQPPPGGGAPPLVIDPPAPQPPGTAGRP